MHLLESWRHPPLTAFLAEVEICFSCCIAPSQDFGSRSLTPEKSKLLKLCKFCKNCCLAAIDNCRNANFWQFSQSCYVIRGMGGEFCKMLEEFKSGSSHSWKNAPQDEYTKDSGDHPSSQHQLPPQLREHACMLLDSTIS